MKDAILIALASAGLLFGLFAWLPRKDETKNRHPGARAKADVFQEDPKSNRKVILVKQETTSEGKPFHPEIDNSAEAIPALIQALGEKTDGSGASHALAQIGSPAVPQLVEALKVDKTRLFALTALCEIGLPAVPALLDATKSRDLSVRRLADMALEQILKAK
jgi:hypothetical protein